VAAAEAATVAAAATDAATEVERERGRLRRATTCANG